MGKEPGAPRKVRDPNKPKKGRSTMEAVKPKQRLNYVNVRIIEIQAELERLKAERAGLREKVAAERGKKAGAAGEED